MSDSQQPVEVPAAPSQEDVAGSRLCVLLACFAGAKRASSVRSVLGEGLRAGGGSVLDEVVLKVNGKGKPQIYDPRRTVAGTLTSALTWGLFGLVASAGSWTSTAIWAVIGAVCGGLFAYYTEHLLSKSQLERIGALMGADSSALTIWFETADASRALASTAKTQPVTASVAVIADDLSARVLTGADNPVESSSTGSGGGTENSSTVLSMVLLRYPGMGTGEDATKGVGASGKALQVELIVEADNGGERRVVSPVNGVAAMAKSDVISWGLFGVVYGALVGAFANGGILSSIDSGVVTGILWAIFGLAAGALYGLWAGRGVSARRLNQVGPILPPDSSMIVAWASGQVTEQTIRALSRPGMERLDLRFNTAGRGAILEV